MVTDQVIDLVHICRFFDVGKDTPQKNNRSFRSVPMGKNTNVAFNPEISKEYGLLEIYNIKRRCKGYVAFPNINNFGSTPRPIYIRGLISQVFRSPYMYKIDRLKEVSF
jgi:hypothetical protein